MGLINSIFKIASTVNQQKSINNQRNYIFEMRDKLRNTPQFSSVFYTLVEDVSRPPRHIETTQNGAFWSEAWDSAMNNYEPYTTQKLSDGNIGYYEGCAIYLLIQECYPNVYDFPGNTPQDIENGATIKLIMKKQFVGKALKPAFEPQKFAQTVPNSSAQTASAFCSGCGSKLPSDSVFCPTCGKKTN